MVKKQRLMGGMRGFAVFVVTFLGMSGLARAADHAEYMQLIEKADRQLLLEHYAKAEDLYREAMDEAAGSREKVYVHYRLGLIYKTMNKRHKARQQLESGIALLDQAPGEEAMRFHLQQALSETAR